jgi:hypothetical protein
MMRNARRSARRVAYLRETQIESAALRLLMAYHQKFNIALAPPIPADEVLESHLGFDLDFDSLPRTPGQSATLGAIWVSKREARIDESLDPSIYPAMEGRYRFTVAHEIGHWELHRGLLLNRGLQGVLFEAAPEPPVICRANGNADPMEWQANQFAAYFLMPRDLVVQAWQARRPDMEPYVAADEIADLRARWDLTQNNVPVLDISRDLAREFRVSGQAMQIRLLKMGVVLPRKEQQGLFDRERAT